MTDFSSRSVVLALAVAVTACAHAPQRSAPDAAARAARPKLIVQLVIDQFRYDYPERYGATWSKGLHRLMTEGAWFTESAYPFAGTVTCAGHASVGTGKAPAAHGMVLNAWWSRETARRINCTTDSAVTQIGLPKAVTGGDSARWMLAPTFAERLLDSQPAGAGRVVSLSLKARSSISLAGRRGDAVVWFDDEGSFATSSAYPDPAWLRAHVTAHPVERAVGSTWTRLKPESFYDGTDEGVGERPTRGWTSRFPHRISDSGAADAEFYDRWQRSPFSDAYLTEMAIAAVDALALGRRAGTDYLAVSFSALDLVGHKFGPRSHEVQDVLLHADVAIGRLLAHLDATVGAGSYVVALTADHGVGEVPETPGGPGGRLPRTLVTKTIEAVLDKAWGDARYVEDEIGTNIFLTPAARERLGTDGDAMTAIRQRIGEIPAVRGLMTAADFAAARGSGDPLVQSLLLSYHPERSGDLLVLLRRDFTSSTDAASHGTYYDYDRRVPVILFGSPFKAGRFGGPASPLDIAPTWARLTGVALDQPYGRSLDSAIK
ncbi:MAG: alkaline phosphatase family protein [Acidobacteriota bacterium]|nr:alkaline phosphatase family protein [Acidobacteriota bacterium]